MTADLRDVAAAAQTVIDREADSGYAHTTHLHVRVAGTVVVDRHLSGPVVADIFSVTKSVLSTVLGLAAIRGRASLAGPAGRRRPASAGRHPLLAELLADCLTPAVMWRHPATPGSVRHAP